MSKRKNIGISVGTSSILVIIVVLSLICFAWLSIVSATADYKLSSQLAQRTTRYYEASNLANQDIAELRAAFTEIYSSVSGEAEYRAKIKESYADSLTFSYPISDSQALSVCIAPVYPAGTKDDCLQITSFCIVQTEELELDTSLPVLLGD